jgi:hypothetical protein
MRTKSYSPFVLSTTLLITAMLACNLPSGVPTPVPAAQTAPPVQPQIQTTNTPQAIPISHVLVPPDTQTTGEYNYDVDSSGTAAEHRAPYGDSFNINLFERPFTQKVMDYHPELDIETFRLTADNDFYYVSIQMVSGDMNSEIGVDYGVEIDQNHDGFGDYLIWAHPAYTTTWTTDTVQVYSDTNHDTGGASADKSDAVFNGNGYDSLIFDQGKGEDSDLAWVRLDPRINSAIQFAFKRTLAGSSFMWGVWADAGLKSPSMFNYNDRFKEADAGSPEKSEKYYPINAIYLVDNTCWAAFGFKPGGYEPHLCPPLGPRPTKKPKEQPGPTPFHLYINICLINPEICAPPPPAPK